MTTREYHFRLLVIDDDRILYVYPKGAEELTGRRAKAALEFLRDDPPLARAVPARSRELGHESNVLYRQKYKMCASLVELLTDIATRSDPVDSAQLLTERYPFEKSTTSRLSKLKVMGYVQRVNKNKYLATPAGHQWLKEHGA